MALFGFSDITFNKESKTSGPLSPLFKNTAFEYESLRYPMDLGNYDKAHYLVFYVRAQEKTQYPQSFLDDSALNSPLQTAGSSSGNAKKSLPGILSSMPKLTNVAQKFAGGVVNSINSATNGALSSIGGGLNNAIGGVQSSISNVFGQSKPSITGDGQATTSTIDNSIKNVTNKSFLKTTTLTKNAIALYMPDTLNYTYAQSYDTLTIGSETAGKALAAGRSGIDAFKQGEGTLDSIKKAAASLGESGKGLFQKEVADTLAKGLNSSQTAQLAFTALTGKVQNPLLEMIYKSPNFRSFQFDFVFYPRDEKEAYEVQKIIERFRFHQAPEIVKGAEGFLIPPSEFDIRFYYAGQQNPNIPTISTCVLTNIDVNYAPNGFQAYEVPGQNKPVRGGTGMPVAIQLSLQFQETTYLTKEDFNEKL